MICKFPYDDDTMVYDYTTHSYRLTENYVLQEAGIVLSEILNPYGAANPSMAAQRFLKKSARSVYRYILQDCWSPQYIEFIMATDGRLRDRIREMLFAQFEYNVKNGFIEDLSGVNVAKGHTIDKDYLRDGVQVSQTVEQLANELLPYYGFSLKYAGWLPCVCKERYHVGY